MTPIRPINHEAQSRVTKIYTGAGDWLCVVMFVAIAAAVTLAPFILF
jgi:hypothetical protein